MHSLWTEDAEEHRFKVFVFFFGSTSLFHAAVYIHQRWTFINVCDLYNKEGRWWSISAIASPTRCTNYSIYISCYIKMRRWAACARDYHRCRKHVEIIDRFSRPMTWSIFLGCIFLHGGNWTTEHWVVRAFDSFQHLTVIRMAVFLDTIFLHFSHFGAWVCLTDGRVVSSLLATDWFFFFFFAHPHSTL